MLLGLPGVAVARVERHEDGGRLVHVVTAGERAGRCPECGVVSTSCKQKVTTTPRDIPYGVESIHVVWHKSRWRCQHADCPRRTFTDTIEQVPARRRTTARLTIASTITTGQPVTLQHERPPRVSWETKPVKFTRGGRSSLHQALRGLSTGSRSPARSGFLAVVPQLAPSVRTGPRCARLAGPGGSVSLDYCP